MVKLWMRFFLDFKKAFDSVPHRLLIHKLKQFGISGCLLHWISDFLSDRYQQVRVEEDLSERAPVLSGVPQGSVLGPLLFSLFINDISDGLSSKMNLYADDCVIYKSLSLSQKSALKTADLLQSDLDQLSSWATKWGLDFSVSKCKYMRVCIYGRRDYFSTYAHTYSIRGQSLEMVDSYEYLGVTIQDNLKWDKHISKVSVKGSQILGMLRRNLIGASKKVKKRAYYSLVRSRLEYACTSWDPYYRKDILRLERINNRASHFISGDKNTSSTILKAQLDMPQLSDRRKEFRGNLLKKYARGDIEIPSLPAIAFDTLPWPRLSDPPTYYEQLRNLFFVRTIGESENYGLGLPLSPVPYDPG